MNAVYIVGGILAWLVCGYIGVAIAEWSTYKTLGFGLESEGLGFMLFGPMMVLAGVFIAIMDVVSLREFSFDPWSWIKRKRQ